ncbi:exodeoxyribonuclease I [Buchnera aphidicola]|uniref:Exodeoxyribonuclease I n=1 Tax=Buchnera aphidicola subsp. Cinara cedri (strain Cc) TaxID=372461 RepID=Q056Y2_BUCCC|nr:exodeoxyribonuclease I [Buchnera aphidicola]ABJ90817.1 exodeoxyribonuclease I [Buchnera aphidicola BCc]
MCEYFSKKKIIFYDYETFGKNVALDKVSQFCSIETDNKFSYIIKKTILFCYPPIDYLPDPEAILITKILPQYTYKYGLNEYFLSKKIHDIFSQKNICIIGYNNINFDNLITRNIFYRNLFDPYEWSWKNNNFSWDILNILRAFYIFLPKSMCWYYNSNGTVSFKLSDITLVNNIKHIHIHDAYSDVYATFLITKYLFSKYKNFFLYLYMISKKKYISSFLLNNINKPFFYISSFFGSINYNFGCIMYIGLHPLYKNNIVIFDLSSDFKKIFNLYKKYSTCLISIKKLFNVGIKVVSISKSPLFFSYNSVSLKHCIRLNIDYLKCQKNFFLLKNNFLIKNWIISCFSYKKKEKINDIDLMLYNNFFLNSDRCLLSFIHKNEPKKWMGWSANFLDNRIKKLFFRLKARNFIKLLNFNEIKKWQFYCKNKINFIKLEEYFEKIKKFQLKFNKNDKNFILLEDLFKYIKRNINYINNLI